MNKPTTNVENSKKNIEQYGSAHFTSIDPLYSEESSGFASISSKIEDLAIESSVAFLPKTIQSTTKSVNDTAQSLLHCNDKFVEYADYFPETDKNISQNETEKPLQQFDKDDESEKLLSLLNEQREIKKAYILHLDKLIEQLSKQSLTRVRRLVNILARMKNIEKSANKDNEHENFGKTYAMLLEHLIGLIEDKGRVCQSSLDQLMVHAVRGMNQAMSLDGTNLDTSPTSYWSMCRNLENTVKQIDDNLQMSIINSRSSVQKQINIKTFEDLNHKFFDTDLIRSAVTCLQFSYKANRYPIPQPSLQYRKRLSDVYEKRLSTVAHLICQVKDRKTIKVGQSQPVLKKSTFCPWKIKPLPLKPQQSKTSAGQSKLVLSKLEDKEFQTYECLICYENGFKLYQMVNLRCSNPCCTVYDHQMKKDKLAVCRQCWAAQKRRNPTTKCFYCSGVFVNEAEFPLLNH